LLTITFLLAFLHWLLPTRKSRASSAHEESETQNSSHWRAELDVRV